MDYFSQFMSPIKTDYPLTGAYYLRRPLTTNDVAETFNYKPIDPRAKRYGQIISNLKTDEQSFSIETNTQCKFKIGGYIITQDGGMWQITETLTKTQEDIEALRLFKDNAKTVNIIRLIAVDNPLGLTVNGV